MTNHSNLDMYYVALCDMMAVDANACLNLICFSIALASCCSA